MSIDQGDWDDGARASASTLLARAAAAARHGAAQQFVLRWGQFQRDSGGDEIGEPSVVRFADIMPVQVL